jgi:hypothetical protein
MALGILKYFLKPAVNRLMGCLVEKGGVFMYHAGKADGACYEKSLLQCCRINVTSLYSKKFTINF